MDTVAPGSVLTPRSLAWWRARPVVLGAVLTLTACALAVAWYLASPLFIRTRLAEQLAATAAPLARGSFSDRDAVHRGSGTATLLRDTTGMAFLQLSDFRVTNGPDLYVYLTPIAAPNTHDDVTRGALQVGRLKASEGGFTYELPPGADPTAYRAAVIYCLQFRTIFSIAPLTRA
ncbi:MAG TPA: DM13 domain-containing protein [Chloroflexota bacterium]|nr:DM13 domain-containing protein [Chloroflexota bacterium]